MKAKRIPLYILAPFCFLLLILEFLALIFHLFLPDPMYTVNTLFEVIIAEIAWGVVHFVVIFLLLSIPLAVLSSVTKPVGKSVKNKNIVPIYIAILISFVFTAREAIVHFNHWAPMELATRNAKERTFMLDKTSFIPMKDYKIKYKVQANNYSLIQNELIPSFAKYNWFLSDFDITINGQRYTTRSKIHERDIVVSSISEVPLSNSIQKNDSANIYFKLKDSYQSIQFMTYAYENGFIINELETY